MAKYSSKKAYLYFRKRKEYYRYLRQYKKARERIIKSGAIPYNEQQNLGALTYANYFSNKQAYIDSKTPNPMRQIIRQQLYKFNYEQAVALHKGIMASKELQKEYGKLSLQEIRTGYKFSLDFLKESWKEIKAANMKLPEDERKSMEELTDEFEQDWFGYTQ